LDQKLCPHKRSDCILLSPVCRRALMKAPSTHTSTHKSKQKVPKKKKKNLAKKSFNGGIYKFRSGLIGRQALQYLYFDFSLGWQRLVIFMLLSGNHKSQTEEIQVEP